MPLFKHYTVYDRIEIIFSDDKADEAARTIIEHAATGLPGDGVIAVSRSTMRYK